MAGCFGNSEFDRDSERQLFKYLDEDADYQEYRENVSVELDADLWDSGLETFFESDRVDKIIQNEFNNGVCEIDCAKLITQLYLNTK